MKLYELNQEQTQKIHQIKKFLYVVQNPNDQDKFNVVVNLSSFSSKFFDINNKSGFEKMIEELKSLNDIDNFDRCLYHSSDNRFYLDIYDTVIKRIPNRNPKIDININPSILKIFAKYNKNKIDLSKIYKVSI